MPTILVVEDNKDINNMITNILKEQHYDVVSCANAIQAIHVFEESTIDLVITDLMMPLMTGEVLIQKIRERSNVHIIVISAKTDNQSKIEGLKVGADDYLFKPFLKEELLLKVHNYFRKNKPSSISINNGDVRFEIGKPQLVFSSGILTLTAVEYKIMKVLIESKGVVLSRDHFLENIYDVNDEVFDRVVDVHIRNIRKKIREMYSRNLIQTIYGLGYQFVGVIDET